MKGRRMRDVISGLLVVYVVALGASAPAWGSHPVHRRSGLAAHLCATHDAVITAPGHALRAIGRHRYFAPIGQAMYYQDTSRRCQLRRTAHRHS
jgi:hypothetical protein